MGPGCTELWGCGLIIGALNRVLGFMMITIVIIRNPQNSIGNYQGSSFKGGLCF